jgi:hypothetical protein
MPLFLLLVLLLAGCSTSELPGTPQSSDLEVYPRVSLTPQQVQLIYAGVQRRLTFPSTARFSGIVAGRKPDGSLHVCGAVDVRTVAGTYTGDQPFYGTLDQRGFVPVTIGGTPEQSQAMHAYCRQQLAFSG